MSTAPTLDDVPNSPGAEAPPGVSRALDTITIYGHSNLLYWWPVWVMSFALAGWTYLDGHQMAVAPDGAEVVRDRQVEGFAEPRDALVAPAGKDFPLAPNQNGEPARAGMTVARSNSLGVIFAVTLLVVAVVSTLTLRGLVSLLTVVLMITAVVTFALLGWWDDILAFFGGLDIRMNAAGYLFIGVPLFLVWAFVVFVYDRQNYLIVDEGQLKYVRDIGDSAMVVQAERATVEKKRNDVFRHWLLGFGTGDIIIRTGSGERIELDNVINANRKLVVVNDMIRHKPVMVEGA